MAQLRADDFIYDGKKLSSFGYKIIEVDQSAQEVGINRSIETVESIGGEYNITKIKQEVGTYMITIAKVDIWGIVQPITQNDLKEINRWLFKPKNYKELVALNNGQGDLVYYAIFTNSEFTYFQNNMGYITLTFQTDGNHAYGQTQEKVIPVRQGESRVVYLDLQDNISDYYYLDVEFTTTEDSFSITNETLGETMTFSNLTTDAYRKGRVYGEGMMFVISLVDPKLNMREKSNKVFLRLTQGRNKLIITGSGIYKFYIEPKVALQ